MSKPHKKKPPPAVPQTDKQYLRSGMARRLPVAECWASSNWHKPDLLPTSVVVARQHKNGDYTIGTYLLDMKCVGLKQTAYRVNLPDDEYRELLDVFQEMQPMERVDYVVAHNIVYGSIAYAEDLGIGLLDQHWALTQYILDEDTDDIELIELEYGFAGKPLYMAGPDDKVEQILLKLDKSVGYGNYGFIPHDPTGQVLEDIAHGVGLEDDADDKPTDDEDWQDAEVVK